MLKALTQLLSKTPEKIEAIVDADLANILLREATQKRDAGEVNAAVDLLKKAYQQIALGSTSYSVSTFLRRPLYLQQAGRHEEAWQEFNFLLTHGFPNQIRHPEVLPMEHSEIYDKMRLSLQREKKFDLAVRFGVCSHISWAIGLHRQNRMDELESYIERENIEENVTSLLKKAKKLNLKDEIADIVMAENYNLPDVDLAEFGRKIDEIVLS